MTHINSLRIFSSFDPAFEMPEIHTPTLWCRTKGFLFHAFPHHAVSRITYWLTRRQTRLKDPLVKLFVRFFGVDMSEAIQTDPCAYQTFNDFFTRALKPGARPIAEGLTTLVSPADGTISQLGSIEAGRIFQAKGQSYTAEELLGGDPTLAEPFLHGRFMTVYLSPRDYHRVHMPCDGILQTMVHVPGRLFSVAPYAVTVIPRLFARNERMIAVFQGTAGLFAVAMVAAVNVAAIETVWAGLVTPPRGRSIQRQDYISRKLTFKKGEEIARFNMGSTAVLLFSEHMAELETSLQPGQKLRLGQPIGRAGTEIAT
jgi:phosphatidylserine decarboxylase